MPGLKIALDDARDFTLEQVDVLFRTPDPLLSFLEHTTQDVDVLYMDNDLGEGVPEGRYVLRYLLQDGVKPQRVVVMTANSVARQAMEKDLVDYGYTQFNERVWEADRAVKGSNRALLRKESMAWSKNGSKKK
jgi:hypothetical protein